MPRYWFGIALLLLSMSVIGCAPTPPAIVPAEGVVLLNGQPLAKADIRFVPMIQGFGAEFIATATTDDKGKFTLYCNGMNGACVGENRVTVEEGALPDEARGESGKAQMIATRYLASLKNRPIPPVYTNLAQSPLSVTITPGQTTYDLKVTR